MPTWVWLPLGAGRLGVAWGWEVGHDGGAGPDQIRLCWIWTVPAASTSPGPGLLEVENNPGAILGGNACLNQFTPQFGER